MQAKILIGALSGTQHEMRRRRCRETWIADARRFGIECVFLMGGTEFTATPILFDDMLLLPCPNSYPALPQRTRWFCKWALEQPNWEYLFKCDDDTYVCIERLAEYDTAGRDYIGGEWTPGVSYASGGGGYLLSRRAAEVVANRLDQTEGAEDLLVGELLKHAGMPLHLDNRFVGIGDNDRRPRSDNDTVTTHAVSSGLFVQSHRETGGSWQFRVVMPTCNRYATTVPFVTLQLLKQHWPDHPHVDLLYYETAPPEFDRVTRLHMGQQEHITWAATLAKYLREHNTNQLVLFMLDDYGVCLPVKRDAIASAQRAMLSDPRIGNVHLTWQPAHPKQEWNGLLRLPPWDYSVNTQAALWRRDLLLEVAQAQSACSIEDFELAGSGWFNRERSALDYHCQVTMPNPSNPSGFVDETDKAHWALPYNNLMRRGSVDPRHAAFLSSHGLNLVV